MVSDNSNSKTVLITGISGQDGAYLAKLLIEKGCRVIGTSRGTQPNDLPNLVRMQLNEKVEIRQLTLLEYEKVVEIIDEIKPHEIYHLSAQSSVAASFERPHETLNYSALAILNLLEAVRTASATTKLFNCTSSECFGNTPSEGATEMTPFFPRSPYGVSKVCTHLAVETYRNSFGLFCCSGILFNHESPLRPIKYVTQKIVKSAKDIAAGSRQKLRLGNIKIARDWGLAAEYVEAMWLMLQQATPKDYVIATGKMSTLGDFLEAAFQVHHLDWKDHTIIDESLYRPQDIQFSLGDPTNIANETGWRARSGLREVVASMTFDGPPTSL